MKIRVLIADDHELVRLGLRHLLEDTADIEVAGEACDGESLLALLRCIDVHVVLLDMKMPGLSGVNLIAHIHREYPGLLILVLSISSDVNLVVSALDLGASGYIGKDCSPEELKEAIKEVSSSGKYLSASIAQKLAFCVVVPQVGAFAQLLTKQELFVCRMLVAGESHSFIASQLNISDRTVSAHKINILKKVKLKNLVELVNLINAQPGLL